MGNNDVKIKNSRKQIRQRQERSKFLMRETRFGSILGRIDSLVKGNPILALEGMDLSRFWRGSITMPIGWTSQKSMELVPLLIFLI